MMPLLYLISGAVLFGLGCFLGWTARDRMAVARSEVAMPLVQVPLADPVELDYWRKPDDDEPA